MCFDPHYLLSLKAVIYFGMQGLINLQLLVRYCVRATNLTNNIKLMKLMKKPENHLIAKLMNEASKADFDIISCRRGHRGEWQIEI